MPGLLRGLARTAMIAGTATAVSNRVSRRQAGRWARQDQQEEPERPEPAPEESPGPDPQAGGDVDNTLAQLKELGELKSQGVLTEAEFAQQKSRILGT
jgi:hypothetical protein